MILRSDTPLITCSVFKHMKILCKMFCPGNLAALEEVKDSKGEYVVEKKGKEKGRGREAQ